MALFFKSFSRFRQAAVCACDVVAVRWLPLLCVDNSISAIGVRSVSGRPIFFSRSAIDAFSRYPNIVFYSTSPKFAVTENSCDSPTKSANAENAREVLANLSPEEEKRLKVLRLEYDVFFSTGVHVPDHVSDDSWLYLLRECPSLARRKSYYSYLLKTERSRLNDKAKRARNTVIQEEKRLARQAEIKADLESDPHALAFKNCFLLRLIEATENRTAYNNLCYAMVNGPHLVFDFSFEKNMSDHEIKSLVNQITICHGLNKSSREPFHFHFCNLPADSKTMRKLSVAIGNLDKVPITITEKSYFDCYPRERLVYLSPNAPTTMNTFNSDDVYIVGSIVDKAKEEPLTFAKAKKEKIRMVQFPLDQNVRWVMGSKSLTLDQVVNIMLEFKTLKDWNPVLQKCLPKRKFTNY